MQQYLHAGPLSTLSNRGSSEPRRDVLERGTYLQSSWHDQLNSCRLNGTALPLILGHATWHAFVALTGSRPAHPVVSHLVMHCWKATSLSPVLAWLIFSKYNTTKLSCKTRMLEGAVRFGFRLSYHTQEDKTIVLLI